MPRYVSAVSSAAALREGLRKVDEGLRAELWWWMAQRGKPEVEAWPQDWTDFDPGADTIVGHDDPGRRRADWALAVYAVLTVESHPDEWIFRSDDGHDSTSVMHAFRDTPLPPWWRETLVGGAVTAIGIADTI